MTLKPLSEPEGCRILTEVFASRGFSLQANVPFDEGGVAFNVDGWDAAARVGFEYRTHEAGDHLDLSDEEIGRLGLRMERGELYLLIVDDERIPDAATLALHAGRFLDEVATRPAAATKANKKKASTSKDGAHRPEDAAWGPKARAPKVRS